MIKAAEGKTDETSALEAHKKAVVRQLSVDDPARGGPFVHDFWTELPTYWVRIHNELSDLTVMPGETQIPGFSGERITIMVNPETFAVAVEEPELWRENREVEMQEIPPEGEHDFAGQKPKRLPIPKGPTETETLEHNLTHLPFRSWCPLFVQSKPRQDHSQKLSLRQPVIQMDFSVVKDK